MVQATALLVAVALTVTASSALADPSCADVKKWADARKLTNEEVIAKAKRRRISDEKIVLLEQCLSSR